MKNLPQYLMYVLLLVGAIVFVVALSADESDPSSYGAYNAMIYTTYIYFGVCILLTLVSAVVNSIVKPETLKGSLIGIGSMAVVLLIGYGMASGEVLSYYPEDTTETAVKLSGGGLYALYILSGLAVLSIIFSNVWKIVKG